MLSVAVQLITWNDHLWNDPLRVKRDVRLVSWSLTCLFSTNMAISEMI